MPDPLTTVGASAIAAYLGKDGLQKLLGPTAEYLGGELKDLAQRRVKNIGRIFQNASGKLGDNADKPGIVPAKVLKEVINEGSYNDSELAAEYFGGVLASSRSETGRDDRGARIAKLVDRLSTYQLRAHYRIYATIRELFHDSDLLFNQDGRSKMQIFIPHVGFVDSMSFGASEIPLINQLMSHVFFGLSSEALIDEQWQSGEPEALELKTRYRDAEDAGIICAPSMPGAELFLYAFGAADQPTEYIFDTSFDPRVEGIPLGISGAKATKVGI